MLLEVVTLQAILWQEEVDNFLKKWNEAVVLCMLITHCNAIYDSFEWGLAVYYVIGIQSHQTTSKAMKYSLIPVAINYKVAEPPRKIIAMENGWKWCIDVYTQDPPFHKNAIPKIQSVHFPMS